ncbi:MAG: hypothetical protein QOG01_4256 [Pseudonocardiales bacterium]|jgi:hypothetical protein|nr:hypothetical protein [Pseudonocardiales bacterium]
MFVFIWVAVTLLATLIPYRLARRLRRRRRTAHDPLARTFAQRDMRELDEHLNGVARHELLRLEREVQRYLTGAVGYVVTIYRAPGGVALELSDGRRLALAGISYTTQQLLVLRTAQDLLKPTHVHRDAMSYRLRLRGEAGTDIHVYARNIALAS